jgi:hypothetical protein
MTNEEINIIIEGMKRLSSDFDARQIDLQKRQSLVDDDAERYGKKLRDIEERERVVVNKEKIADEKLEEAKKMAKDNIFYAEKNNDMRKDLLKREASIQLKENDLLMRDEKLSVMEIGLNKQIDLVKAHKEELEKREEKIIKDKANLKPTRW